MCHFHGGGNDNKKLKDDKEVDSGVVSLPRMTKVIWE